MKEYILINRVPVTYSTEDAKLVTTQWNALTDQWKAAGSFVSSFVFPSTGFVISGDPKTTSHETVLAGGLQMVSTIILRASDYEEVLVLAGQCPILRQGGSVEVVETMKRLSQPES